MLSPEGGKINTNVAQIVFYRGKVMFHFKQPIRFSHLSLNIFDADDGLLVLLRGLLVVSLFVELVPLAVQHGDRLQPLRIAQGPRLPVVLTGLLHLHNRRRIVGLID